MTIPAATTAEYAPIFSWETGRRRKVSLISFLAASVLLHALCFYLFQIIYPPTVALLPPPARVNLITANSEEGRLLLRWIEAEDPALSSLTQRPPDAVTTSPPTPPHVPSYVRHQPELKQLPAPRPDLSIPSAEPPGPVALPPPPPPAPARPVATTVRFEPTTAGLGAPEIPPLHFTASNGVPPDAAQFRVGISAHGVVRFCFLERPSGDPALDEQARQHLLLCRFPMSENQSSKIENFLIWTTATVAWGNDIASPPAAATESPRP